MSVTFSYLCALVTEKSERKVVLSTEQHRQNKDDAREKSCCLISIFLTQFVDGYEDKTAENLQIQQEMYEGKMQLINWYSLVPHDMTCWVQWFKTLAG